MPMKAGEGEESYHSREPAQVSGKRIGGSTGEQRNSTPRSRISKRSAGLGPRLQRREREPEHQGTRITARLERRVTIPGVLRPDKGRLAGSPLKAGDKKTFGPFN